MPSRVLATASVLVCTTMPSLTTVAQAGCCLGIFSTCTRHMRHTATGSILGWAQ
jgi:hypothetical protein